MKDYLIKLLTTAAPENGCAQDAIEHAIFNGQLQLTYDLQQDLEKIAQQYDVIIESFQHYIQNLSVHQQMMDDMLGSIHKAA